MSIGKSLYSKRLRVLFCGVLASLSGMSVPLLANAFLMDDVRSSESVPSDETTLSEAVRKSDVELDFRLRYEDASQDSTSAQALTLRSRLALNTQRFNLFSAGLRFDDIRALPDDENYFSGTNDQTDDLLIADPELTELSNAWIAYDIANTLIKYGKQDFLLNNERLIGSQSWRQNSNTFNGLSLSNDSFNYTTLRFARFTGFENSFDPNTRVGKSNPDISAFSWNYRGLWRNELSLYGLTIDGHKAKPLWSTETYGVFFNGVAGDRYALKLVLDYARQVDKGSNPHDYDAVYRLADLSFIYDERFAIKLGYENLGADADTFFVTPLASSHEFQGWTDTFSNGGLGNIEGGIRDKSVELSAFCGDKFSVNLNYHEFTSVDKPASFSSGDLGEEYGIKFDYIIEQLTVVAKYADYHADQFGSDETRAWLGLRYTF